MKQFLRTFFRILLSPLYIGGLLFLFLMMSVGAFFIWVFHDDKRELTVDEYYGRWFR